MEWHLVAADYDHLSAQLPIQWCLKGRAPDGRMIELQLRRVKQGHETPVETIYDTEHLLIRKARFSDARSLVALLTDTALLAHGYDELCDGALQILERLHRIAKANLRLLALFTTKGKIELYGKGNGFQPQYISGNYTLKLHILALADASHEWVSHLVAQHLDYPFGPGERRYSTSRLFDLCFNAEKVITPNGLAAQIDEQLHQRGIFRSELGVQNAHHHVAQLLDGHSAGIQSAYERVLQRERFASLVRHSLAPAHIASVSPILSAYQSLIDVDLRALAKAEYKDYPSRGMDQLASAVHLPLTHILTVRQDDRARATVA